MSETNAPEPTMEEILASIRRIISEDDAPAPAEAQTSAAGGDPPRPAESAPEPASAAHHDDVLELTERVEPDLAPVAAAPPPTPPAEEPASATLGDLDFSPAAAPASPFPPPSQPASSPAPSPVAASSAPPAADEPLVGAGTAGRAADHFGALQSSLVMPAAGRTLEDVTRELLRPLLKEWLDLNLAAIVEARVQDEVERISRRRTY